MRRTRRSDERGSSKGRTSAPLTLADRVLFIGVVLGSLVTSAVRFSGGRNAFGPPKAVIFAAGVALALIGLSFAPASLARVVSIMKRSRVGWALMAAVLLAALSSVTAFDPRRALLGGYPDYRGFATLLGVAALGVAWIAVWVRDGGPRLIGRTTVVLSLAPLSYAFLQRVGVYPADWRGQFRVGSLLGNPSNFGVYLLIVAPLVLWVLASEKSSVWRILAGASAAGSVAAIFWTLSRGAWVGGIAAVAVAGGLVLVSGKARARRAQLALVLVSAVLLVSVAAAVTPGFTHRASHLLDAGSKTARLRLSAWNSSAHMALARPLLGWGPDNFRYVLRLFQAPGQIGGAYGYQVVESAHNLEADTATSSGLLGVAGLSGLTLVRRARTDRDPGLPIALAAALTGAFVALQFHYVTMDTGAALAMVFAGVVMLEVPEVSVAGAGDEGGSLRWIVLGVGVLYAAACIALACVVVADARSVSATRLALRGAPWATVEAEFKSARALAPWEPEFDRVEGSAANAVLLNHFDRAAYLDGLAAYDRAVHAHPGDAVMAAARADLLLAAGESSRDRALIVEAAEAFGAVERMDPNTGIATVGRATALLSLGQTEQAVSLLKSGLSRSPRYRLGWENLAAAYDKLGNAAAAAAARKETAKIPK